MLPRSAFQGHLELWHSYFPVALAWFLRTELPDLAHTDWAGRQLHTVPTLGPAVRRPGKVVLAHKQGLHGLGTVPVLRKGAGTVPWGGTSASPLLSWVQLLPCRVLLGRCLVLMWWGLVLWRRRLVLLGRCLVRGLLGRVP
jgi:hypothetical protein